MAEGMSNRAKPRKDGKWIIGNVESWESKCRKVECLAKELVVEQQATEMSNMLD